MIARYLLLASSTPLRHQEDALMHSEIPVVMTIGSSEKYFGGAFALSSVARRVGAWRVEFGFGIAESWRGWAARKA